MHDIDTIIQTEKNVDEHHEPPLLNFEKWTHLKDQAISTMRYRDVLFAYEKQGLGMAMAYLTRELQIANTGEDLSLVFRKKAARLKKKEGPLMGVIAAKKAGFRIRVTPRR